jgi:hypothetical protein
LSPGIAGTKLGTVESLRAVHVRDAVTKIGAVLVGIAVAVLIDPVADLHGGRVDIGVQVVAVNVAVGVTVAYGEAVAVEVLAARADTVDAPPVPRWAFGIGLASAIALAGTHLGAVVAIGAVRVGQAVAGGGFFFNAGSRLAHLVLGAVGVGDAGFPGAARVVLQAAGD